MVDYSGMKKTQRDQLTRLNRARGQLDGVAKMLISGRDSKDVLVQLRAARSALRALETNILRAEAQKILGGQPLEIDRERGERAQLEELIETLLRHWN